MNPKTFTNLGSTRPCIVLGSYGSLSEVFVRRHIKFLNSGDNLVLSTQASRSSPNRVGSYRRNRIIRLYFVLRGKVNFPGWLDRIILNTGISGIKLSCCRYLLFEFGALAVDNYELAIYSRIPYFIYFRGYDASLMLCNPQYVGKLRILVVGAEMIFSVSPHLMANLEKKSIFSSSSLVMPSSVEPLPFIPSHNKNPNLFVSIGRMVEKKGHEFTLRAFHHFLKSTHATTPRLIIIGDGPLLMCCRELALALEIEEYVVFKGATDNNTVLRLLKRATFYIQSSVTASNGDTEGFPSAIQEAMMHSCVIICSLHGGVPYYLRHGTEALISPEELPIQMANNLIQVFHDPSLVESLSKSAYAAARNKMNIVTNMKQIEACIEDSLLHSRKVFRD
jgi:glycosyltransferase involved in cell wall biosynthesis